MPADFPHVFHKRRHATPLRPRRGDNAWPRSSARAALRAAVRAEPGTMPKIARIRNLTRSSARFPIRTVRSDLTWKPTVRGRAPGAAAAWAVPRPAASSPRPQDRRLRPDKARGNPAAKRKLLADQRLWRAIGLEAVEVGGGPGADLRAQLGQSRPTFAALPVGRPRLPQPAAVQPGGVDDQRSGAWCRRRRTARCRQALRRFSGAARSRLRSAAYLMLSSQPERTGSGCDRGVASGFRVAALGGLSEFRCGSVEFRGDQGVVVDGDLVVEVEQSG